MTRLYADDHQQPSLRMCRAHLTASRWGRVVMMILALAAGAGCGHRTWHYAMVPNVSAEMPEYSLKTIYARRPGMPPEPFEMVAGGDQNVLIASLTHDNPDRDLDEWGRAFVVLINGPLVKGKLEVTPENGRYIEYGPIRVARKPYMGLDGSVDILGVSVDRVTAYCALRSRTLDANTETRVLRGLYDFRLATGEEPFLHDTGIQYHGPR